MLSIFKKKEKVELTPENFMHANPQDFGWDLVGENDLSIPIEDVYIEGFVTERHSGGRVERYPVAKESITKNRVLRRDETQGSQVLSILKENPEGLTRYEIKDLYIKQFGDILDTSLSRAISCLSYDTTIKMTDATKLERYGKVCHIYKAN